MHANSHGSMDALNDTGLGREDRISVLDIDTPGSDGLFNVRQLKPTGGYSGVAGDGVLRLHGFDVEVVDDSTLRFFLVNHRVPVVTKGKPLDADKVGANSTVEVFEVKRGSDDMKYIKTIFDSNIYTPNNIAAMGDGGFVVTNDHSRKRGLRRQLDPIMGGGSVTYCDAASRCNIAKEGGFNFPNGLVRGHDDLVYVPSSSTGQAWVFQLHRSNGTLTQVAQFSLGYPVDNLSVDQRGDIFGAAFPKVLKMLKMFKDPWHATPPGTVIKIVKAKEGYSAEKVLEDNDGKLVSGVTIARHDSKTGRFFLSSKSSPLDDKITPDAIVQKARASQSLQFARRSEPLTLCSLYKILATSCGQLSHTP